MTTSLYIFHFSEAITIYKYTEIAVIQWLSSKTSKSSSLLLNIKAQAIEASVIPIFHPTSL